MSVQFIYPIVTPFENIIPVEFPFVKMRGPKGCAGILLVFETREAYDAYAEGDHEPLLVQNKEKTNVEQNGRNERESKSNVSSSGKASSPSEDRTNDVVDRRRKHRASQKVGREKGHGSGR